MNLNEINTNINQITSQSLRELSVPTTKGLVGLKGRLDNMGHNYGSYKDNYPFLNPENKSHNGFSCKTKITFANNLIDVIEETVSAEKPMKMAVVVDVNPFNMQKSHPDSSEQVLYRHTTLSDAQRRTYFRRSFYDANFKAQKQTKFWNGLTGSNQVNYVFGVNLLARAPYHIVESELPQTDSNASRLAKELFVDYPNTFNVITLDMPAVPRNFKFNELSKSAKETLIHAVYQKLYKACELAQKNRIKKLVITEMGMEGKIPVDIIVEQTEKVLKEFVFFKGKFLHQTVTEIVFVSGKHFEQKFANSDLLKEWETIKAELASRPPKIKPKYNKSGKPKVVKVETPTGVSVEDTASEPEVLD